MSLSASAWNNLSPTERIFIKPDTHGFQKSAMKIQVSLKCGKNNSYFTWRPIYIFDNILLISSENEKHFRHKL